MAEGVSGVEPATSTQEIHVTGRRVLATIVDWLVFAILLGVMSALSGQGSAGSGGGSGIVIGASLNGLPALIFFVLVVLYYIILEGYLGQTLGKMLCGIKVVREDTEEAPGLGAAAIRTVLRLIDGLFGYLVAFIVVLVSGKRQRLGDMAAHTLVVRK
jgi:uncharacterized RDD family membrane protein YckC